MVFWVDVLDFYFQGVSKLNEISEFKPVLADEFVVLVDSTSFVSFHNSSKVLIQELEFLLHQLLGIQLRFFNNLLHFRLWLRLLLDNSLVVLFAILGDDPLNFLRTVSLCLIRTCHLLSGSDLMLGPFSTCGFGCKLPLSQILLLIVMLVLSLEHTF